MKYKHAIDDFLSLSMGIIDASDSHQNVFANVCVHDGAIDWNQIIEKLV